MTAMNLIGSNLIFESVWENKNRKEYCWLFYPNEGFCQTIYKTIRTLRESTEIIRYQSETPSQVQKCTENGKEFKRYTNQSALRIRDSMSALINQKR